MTFIKAQASSLVATCFDFLTTIVLVNVFGWWYLAGSVTGTIAGGVLNFMLGRLWTFNAADARIEWQFIKYALVWAGSLLLNAAGVFVITHYIGASYIISKIITSVAVGIGYNYVLQKKFVFR
ncbi:MAG TPA: GtrA family protein [Chitinophaga sp.]|jgi:putative flippase GtrA|uniref:GtrA family protein n=1 Tax=Chitinophaga sp. TaxID=1869181 RepID=UPI002DBDE5BA|nr:GtrA family protein [Chitinophaga sp.]HEU4552663.1 GtrA family protein [Chitinophaga sp.]